MLTAVLVIGAVLIGVVIGGLMEFDWKAYYDYKNKCDERRLQLYKEKEL